ncbi:MAG: DUF4301 family protein [Bacteroidota bacterium]
MFSSSDSEQFQRKGIHLPILQKQLEYFKKGFPFIRLNRPAKPGDGLLNFNDHEREIIISNFNDALPLLKVVKFVPASGAASRMFKHLFEFREICTSASAGAEFLTKDLSFNSVSYLITHLGQIAFFEDLSDQISNSGNSIEQVIADQDYGTLIDFLLTGVGLDYANLPKALLKFHRYPEEARTAAEEHMVEAAEYTKDNLRIARIHFTISPEHQEKFLALLSRVKQSHESRLNVHFEISFSIQKPSTDTIAVDENNQPVRNQDGSLLFRPGGHGALLENLNEVEADLVFIKNIDNVVPDRLKEITFQNKKLLGGYLIYIKERISGYLSKIKNHQVTPELIDEMTLFVKEKLFLAIPDDFLTHREKEQADFIFNLMNRPIRVCGMVKNEGEPGGGPFWVTGDDNNLSLQIVEASQINMQDPAQKSIASTATHFNPVDLVCSIKDFEGNKFDLSEFVDENTGFISLKSSGGKTLKAQELPGLWNGAMAKWITIFIEVPIITFNPVKTVNDLLRKEHLAN